MINSEITVGFSKAAALLYHIDIYNRKHFKVNELLSAHYAI